MAVKKWKWSETDVGKQVQGKNGLTRFVGWLNSLFNEDHAWFDYDSLGNTTDSLINRYTDSAPTGGEIQRNEMQMQNMEDQYQRQVVGMQKAGLNPALMYGSGASGSSPSVQTGASNPSSMSEMMQLLMLPQQMKMMQAQTRNIEANSEKTLADTEQVKLAIQYYPSLTEKTIAEIASRTDLNVQNLSLAKVQEEIQGFEKIIKKSESEYADVYFDLRNQFMAAQRDSQLESAAESAARAAWTEFETQWTKDHNGARPSSSALVGLLETLVTMFGAESNQKQQGIILRAVETVTNPDTYTRYINLPPKTDSSKRSHRAYMRARRALTGRGLVLD